jgi:hypothetical protein
MIDYGGCPDHRDDNQHLYYVVLPPFRRDGTSSEESLPIELNQTELGTNTTGFHRSVLDPNHSNLPLLHFACIMTRNRQFTQSPTGLDVDATTEVYSHELVESITNPEGTGIYDDTPSDCGSEVTGSSCELAEEIKNNNNEISKHALLTGILIISSSVGAELLIQKKK